MARRTTSPSSRSRSKAKTIDTPVLVEVPSAAATKPETFDPYWQQLEHESNTTAHSNLDQIPTADDRSTDEPDAEPQLSPIEGSDRPVNRSGSADSNGKGLSQKSKRQARSKKPAFKVGDRVYSITDDQQDLVIQAIKDGIATCKPPYRTQIAVKLENLRPWKFRFAVGDWFRVGEGKSLHYVAQVNHDPALVNNQVWGDLGWLPHPCCDDEYLDWVGETSNLHRAAAPDWADLRETDRVAWIRPDRLARLGVIQKIDYKALTAEIQWDEPLEEDKGNPNVNIADLTQLHWWNHEWKIGDRIVQDGNKPEWAPKDRMTALISHGTILDIRFYCGHLTPWVKWETGVEAGSESWGIVSEFHPWDEATEEPEPLPPDEPPMTAEQVIEEMDRAMQAAQVSLSVPASPQVEVEPGDEIQTSSGIATVTRTETAGNETIIHADYGSGIEQPHVSEGIQSTPQLADLAAQFNQLEQDADQARQTQLNAGRAHWEARRDQGAILLQAKAQVTHGGWQSWVEENCKAADGKPLSIRMAQIYMQVATHWDEIAKNEMHFAFGLEAGLKQLRKTLKPQPQQLTLQTEATSVAPDSPIPPLDELKRLYEPIGTVKDWGQGFCVERSDLGNPFPLAFKTPALAWDYWQQKGEKLLALAQRKPKIEAPQTLEPPPQTWTIGDQISTPPNNKGEKVTGEVIGADKKQVCVRWRNGQESSYSPKDMEVFGYQKEPSAVAEPTPEADLDTLFESAMAEALEPVQEWLGEKAMQKHLNATQTAIGQLGALPVGLRAAYEADHDDLLRLREFIDLMLEMD